MSTAKKTTKAPAKPTSTKTTKPPAAKATLIKAREADPVAAKQDRDVMRKKELVDAVVARSGIKKKDAKPVVEAMLAELGEALAAGRDLVLPPFGRTKLNREKVLSDGRVLIVKIRQKDQSSVIRHSSAAAE